MQISLQAVADSVFHYGGLTLIHATVLALITWLLSATLLRRSRPAVKAAIWTIVLVKFLLPPVLPGEMALSGWIGEAVANVTVFQGVSTESARQDNRQPAINFRRAAVESTKIPVAPLLFIGYLFLVSLLSVRALIVLRRTRRRITALPLADDATRAEILTLAKRVGLKRPPDVRMTHEDMTPYVFGFRQAVLVLPEWLTRILEPSELEALVLHELAHIRRRDVLIRGLQSCAGILFFFFPPVLWVCRRVEHFTEMACDSWALAESEIEPYAYASSLLRVVKEMRHAPQPQVGLPLVRQVRLLEERLRAVMRVDVRKSARLSRGARIVLTCWAGFVLAGGAATEASKKTSNRRQILTTKAVISEPTRSAIDSESQQLAPPGKENGKKQTVLSKQTEAHERRAPAAAEVAPTSDGSFVRSQQLPTQLPTSKPLSPYERGYLAGKSYAQERSSQLQPQPSEEPSTSGRQSTAEFKREFEMRMQRLTKQP